MIIDRILKLSKHEKLERYYGYYLQNDTKLILFLKFKNKSILFK